MTHHTTDNKIMKAGYLVIGFLSSTVIALIIWGSNVNVNNAVQQQKIETIAKSVEEMKSDIKEIKNDVNQLKLQDAKRNATVTYSGVDKY